MDILDDNVFQILCTAKRLADNGFLEPFLERCGSYDLGREEFYDFAWEAVGCVFPDYTGYWNQENEIDTIVITSAAKDRKAKDGGRNWKRQRDDAVICA